MKKLIIVFLLLFLLTGCYYTSHDVDEAVERARQEVYDEYAPYEELYYSAHEEAEEYGSAICNLSEYFTSVYLYYIDHDSDVTESEALEAIAKMYELFSEYIK